MKPIKRITAVMLSVLLVAVCALSSSAEEDARPIFDVKDGVLVEYTGVDADVTIPGSIYKIADRAFSGNKGLKSVEILDSVSVIGEQAFRGCTALKDVTGGKSVALVGKDAFAETAWLSETDSDLKTLGGVVVAADTKIEKLDIPDGIFAIAPNAFAGCDKLAEADLTGIADIGDYAFDGCKALADITFSTSLKYAGVNCFDSTKWLDSMDVDFVSANGILIKYKGKGGSVVVPGGTLQIAGGAFANIDSVASVVLPADVYYIGKNAFTNSPLVKITLPDSLTYIGDEAFSFCVNLGSVTIPSATAYLGNGAFYGCTSLKNVDTGGIESLKYITFAKCTALNSVIVGGNLKSIENYAFSGCTALKEITLPDNVISIGNNSFDGCNKLVIAANEGSYAFEYAAANGYDTEKIIEASGSGDVDGNGKISMVDVTTMQQHIAEIIKLEDKAVSAGDMNKDGKLTMDDVITLQKKIAGLI